MTSSSDVMVSGLYSGLVVHKRLKPVRHAFKYEVFSLLLDCERLEELGKTLRLFSYNRFNLFALYDRDHDTKGESLKVCLHNIASQAGEEGNIRRFMILCYPRVLGYVFNPLTVYFGLGRNDEIRLIVYEVKNTFGGLHRYILPVHQTNDGVIEQECEKEFYVSPFNTISGRYIFHVLPPSEDVTVGVALKTHEGPILKTHFKGSRKPLTDKNLLIALWQTGWLTVKVIMAIHYEALRLWLKGLRVPSVQIMRNAGQKTQPPST